MQARTRRQERRHGTIRGGQKPQRNEPCPCGSKIKYKLCCGATPEQQDPKAKAKFIKTLRRRLKREATTKR